MSIKGVEGVFTLADGTRVQFRIDSDGFCQSWGASREAVGQTVDAREAMEAALIEVGAFPDPDEDEDEPEEDEEDADLHPIAPGESRTVGYGVSIHRESNGSYTVHAPNDAYGGCEDYPDAERIAGQYMAGER